MKKVLISSFAVSPVNGSESGLGWNYCSRVGRYHQATVLYGSEKRTFERDFSVEKYIAEHGEVENVRFVWVEPSPFARKLLKWHDQTGIEFFYYWAYNSWQKTAFKKAKELDAEEHFDLFHQFNMIGFREPGYLWKMKRPFIWGPVGGTVNISLKYYSWLGFKGSLRSLLRNSANYLQLRLSGRVNKAGKNATLIVAASSSEKRNLQKHFPSRPIEVVNETGSGTVRGEKQVNTNGRLRLLWSGTHTPGKAFPLLLEAMQQLKGKTEVELIVLGQGKETSRWKKMADQLGVSEQINWVGQVPRTTALDIMNNTDVTVFTSLKEGTPHVVLESLSLGIPVICLDLCGMGDVVTSNTGIKVAVENRTQMVTDFAAAIKKLDSDRSLLAQLSRGALVRARECNWENKIARMMELYGRAMQAPAVTLINTAQPVQTH